MTVKQLIEWLQEFPSHYDVRVIKLLPYELIDYEFTLQQGNLPPHEETKESQAVVDFILED